MNALHGHFPGLRARALRAGEGRPWRAEWQTRIRYFVGLFLCGLSGPLMAQTPLPSGQTIIPLDTLIEQQIDGQSWLVLRYLAPRIARGTGDLDYEAVVEDLDLLCQTAGLAAASELGSDVQLDQIVIVLLDRPVERGVPDPDATQFIGAYVPVGDTCSWD